MEGLTNHWSLLFQMTTFNLKYQHKLKLQAVMNGPSHPFMYQVVLF